MGPLGLPVDLLFPLCGPCARVFHFANTTRPPRYRCLQNKRHWHRAHKGKIGDPQGGPGGPSPISRTPGKVRGNHFLKGIWGETGSPKCLLVTIQSIPVTGNPIILIFETIPQRNHVFPTPILVLAEAGHHSAAAPRQLPGSPRGT